MIAVRTFFFTPEQQTLEPAFLALITSAQHSLRLMMFAFTLHDVALALIARHQAGVDVRCVLDIGQSIGPGERPIIAALQAAAIPLAIGNSADRDYMHEKAVIADGLITAYGSWNASHAASRETNHLVIDRDPSVAASFTLHWNAAWQAITGSAPV